MVVGGETKRCRQVGGVEEAVGLGGSGVPGARPWPRSYESWFLAGSEGGRRRRYETYEDTNRSRKKATGQPVQRTAKNTGITERDLP